MTKAQALAMLNAMEGAAIPGSAVLSFPAGAESWAIQLDASHVYTAPQVTQIANYCTTNGLALSATFSALGVT